MTRRLQRGLVPGCIVVVCLALWVAAAATEGSSSSFKRELQCVRRTATATPPPRVPPAPTTPKRQRAEVQEVGGVQSCPAGQVPVIVPAKPNVAKGNPLIGPVSGTPQQFFGSPAQQSKRIRRALRPFREIYPRGGGKPPRIARAGGPGCNGILYYGACYYYGSAAFGRVARGGGTTMGISRPAYDGSGGSGHSLDEISVQGGSGSGNIIELGWNVSTAQYPNANPHLFVFHWIAWAPTCYDTCGWHQYSGTYAPGGDLGALVGREVYVGWVYFNGNWWAWFDNQWLGYFSGKEWPAGYTSNALIQWFGEVASNNGLPPHTDMGSGTFPPSAAATRNATLCDVDPAAWVCWYRDQQATSETFAAYYQSRRSGFGQVRFGGPGE